MRLQLIESAALKTGHSTLNTCPSTLLPAARSTAPAEAPLGLLILDVDPTMRSACCEIAASMGFRVHEAFNVEAARDKLKSQSIDVIIAHIPFMSFIELDFISEIKLLYPQLTLIAMAGSASVSSAVEAMRSGASDFLGIPFTVEELSKVLERAIATQRAQTQTNELHGKFQVSTAGGMTVRTPGMEKLLQILPRVAQSSHSVLIQGESGTGKEVIAKALHAMGPNAHKQFLAVDCGALSPTLIESELFGHVKGAFTGASGAREGLLVSANGGTIFLDEIGELPLEMQTRLLRALQEKEVRPIGSNRAKAIDARILAATNCDLAKMVSSGSFRKDLYYRLNVVALRIPPLRERKEDIPVLAAYFLNRNNANRDCRQRFMLSDEVLRAMVLFDWPGNVRQLENVIDRACALAGTSKISVGDLPTLVRDVALDARTGRSRSTRGTHVANRTDIIPLADLERNAILDAVRAVGGDKLGAASLLGIGKTTLYRKLKEYKL